jgi:hypothetical protein
MALIVDNFQSEGRLRGSGLIVDLSTQATANSTLSLTVSSNTNQNFSGTTAGQIVKLPDATTLLNGRVFYIWNQSTQSIALQDNGGNALRTIRADTAVCCVLVSNGTSNGSWVIEKFLLTEYSVDATATTSTTNTSVTDVLADSMTLTPPRGVYRVNFSSSIVNSANGAQRTFVSLYVGGVQQTHTEIPVGTAGGAYAPVSISAQEIVDGTQAIEVRWRVAAGTSTMTQRTLSVLRID